MNEEPIKEALHQIARKRTRHHADLWPRIERQVQPRHRGVVSRLRLATPLGAGLVIVLLLTLSAGAYAAIQHQLFFVPDIDPGLQQVQDGELGTTLNQSQTIDGVTLQLEWAYADAHRVVVFYSLTQNESPFSSVNTTALDIQLRTAEGTVLPRIFGGGGGGGGGGVTPAPYTFWSFSGSINFDSTAIPSTVSDLALHLDLRMSMEGVRVGEESSERIELGPFGLDFVVPFIPAAVFEPAISQTAGDMSLTLEQVSVTPSSTTMTLCVTVQDQYWLPEAHLDTGEEVLADIGFIGIAPQASLRGTKSCAELDFLAPYRGEAAVWTLTVDRLQGVALDGSPMTAATGPWVYHVTIP